MTKIITSDEFLVGIISVLANQGITGFSLAETELDASFERAYKALVDEEDILHVKPNFTFLVNPFHGDSVCLRDTLFAAREKALIEINNPTLRTFKIKLSESRADKYIAKNPLPKSFFEKIIESCFSNLARTHNNPVTNSP